MSEQDFIATLAIWLAALLLGFLLGRQSPSKAKEERKDEEKPIPRCPTSPTHYSRCILAAGHKGPCIHEYNNRCSDSLHIPS